jgi:RimJ/RimL family protein N-acetyltransferase
MTDTPDSADRLSSTISNFWNSAFLGGEILYRDARFTLAANPDLDHDSRVMLLTRPDGLCMAVVTPELAGRLGLRELRAPSAASVRRRLADAGLALHGADCLFYCAATAKRALLDEADAPTVRALTARDADAFAAFQSSASEQDLDDAYVELDHWAVFGAFVEGRLVSAASMYAWENSRLADLGVLTLAHARGHGHARRVVRALCRHAYAHGCEPQYRCQTDNAASVALARSVGLTLYGTWEVVSPDCDG